jgi:hypothetical protein
MIVLYTNQHIWLDWRCWLTVFQHVYNDYFTYFLLPLAVQKFMYHREKEFSHVQKKVCTAFSRGAVEPLFISSKLRTL